ncbi:MAG TPA: response regulator [Vicinamibacterales bacterium]
MTHTLLLADDSVTIQRVIELTFADEDVQVVAVSDGDQAIARLETAPPDIVLADIGMPGKNGYEVAKYVKQSPKLSHIPVVLLTGAFEPVDQARAAEVGCDGVLAKPFEPQLVIGRVKELLSSEMPVATVPAAPTTAQASHPADLDDYFDRLDVAFSKLSGGTGRQSAEGKPGSETPADVGPIREASEPPASVADEIDRYVTEHAVEHPADLTLSPEPTPRVAETPFPAPPAEAAVARPDAQSTASDRSSEPPAAAVPVLVARPSSPAASLSPAERASSPISRATSACPSVAEAFAAILAAEEGDPLTAARPGWPVFQPPPAPEPVPAPPIDLSDEQVDRIVGQVLDRMSDRVVRETVTGIATDTAERLVREEIERIKNAIK